MSWGKIKDFFLFSDKGPVSAPNLTEVKPVSEAGLWTEKLLSHPHRTYRIKDDEVDSFMQGVVECFGEWERAPCEVIWFISYCEMYGKFDKSLKEKKEMLGRYLVVDGKPFMWRGKTFVLDKPVYNKPCMMM